MTPGQVDAVARKYLTELQGQDYEPKKFTLNGQLPNHQEAREHIAWMCLQILEFCQPPFRLGKADRWLGFVQGVLWFMGDKTIDEMRDDNRDTPESFTV